MKIESRSLADIKPYERNPRQNDSAVEAVAASIREFGFRQPIVVDADGVVIVGQRQRPPLEGYTVASYRRAIVHACDEALLHPELSKIKRANLTDEQRVQIEEWRRGHHWHPQQLRHNAATRMRKDYGLYAAPVILGHKSPAITGVQAEIGAAKAVEITVEVG